VAATAAAPADTFPKLLARNAELFRGRSAIRHKDLGIWQAWTWDQVFDEVRTFSMGLAELGLGRDEIASDLQAGLAAVVTGRSPSYWEVVAMSFTNRARSHTQLAAFEEAGIERYRYEAVMDEVTSVQCRFLNGRIFSVDRAMRRFRDVEEERDPERISELQPLIQKGEDNAGNEFLFFERGGQRQLVAIVERSAAGERDAAGRFSRELSTDALEAAGVTVPPAHFRCRSTIVALS